MRIVFFLLCLVQISFAQPVNDDCANALALPLTTNCIPLTVDAIGATGSGMAACSGTDEEDVWFSFTTTADRAVIEVIPQGDYDPVIELFDGCGGSSLQCEDNNIEGEEEIMYASNLTAATTYYVRVFDYYDSLPSNMQFDICVHEYPAAPANDECSGAETLTATATCNYVEKDLKGATQSLLGCSSQQLNAFDVWYKFVATQTAHIINVIGDDYEFDPVIELFDACGGNSLACRDENLGSGKSERLKVSNLKIGTTYYFRVYNFLGDDYPSFTKFKVCVQEVPAAPVNDECAGATTLTVNASCVGVQVENVSATQSDTSCYPNYYALDTWFKFVANENDLVVQVDPSPEFDPMIEVLDACSGTSLGCTDENYEGETEQAQLSNLIPGNTYYARVFDIWGEEPATTDFFICVYPGIVGVEEIAKKEFEIFPNPAKDQVQLKGMMDQYSLRSITGEVLLNKAVQGSSASLDLSNYPNGIYFLEIHSGEKVVYKKLIKY